MILGCIGDDFTGSSDLANTLARGGMLTVQYCGIPAEDARPEVEAGVVALKSRTIPAADAVAQSLAALEWLKRQGCRQFFFKYCSTFDSTDDGNIGPVAEALADALNARSVVFCPAFPATGRTVYQGHLFVVDRLLSESGMQDHPLTPMRDPDLRRVLARQTKGRVGHVAYAKVALGRDAIIAELDRLTAEQTRLVIIDAIWESDLIEIGKACDDALLVTGGSGVAMGLPANFAVAGLLSDDIRVWRGMAGPVVALAGSVSTATRRQVERHRSAGHPLFEVRAADVIEGKVTASDLANWLLAQRSGVPLAYSSADPESVADAQRLYGKERVSQAIERLFAETAAIVVERGTKSIVCAGGETSGAIVTRLHAGSLEIGPEIDPGVPALLAHGKGIALALKSGNFGADDFFQKAAAVLGGGT